MSKLDELIPMYAQNKMELDGYKKIVDKENAEIKELMQADSLDRYETGGYRAVYTVSKRETMNEEGLIALFTSVPGFVRLNDSYGVVKQRPYIDFDVLEKLLYDGKFSDEQIMDLDKTRETKEVVSLRVTKIKKRSEDE